MEKVANVEFSQGSGTCNFTKKSFLEDDLKVRLNQMQLLIDEGIDERKRIVESLKHAQNHLNETTQALKVVEAEKSSIDKRILQLNRDLAVFQAKCGNSEAVTVRIASIYLLLPT